MIPIDTRYMSIVADITVNGYSSDDRTTVGTKTIFGVMEKCSLEDNYLPALSMEYDT